MEIEKGMIISTSEEHGRISALTHSMLNTEQHKRQENIALEWSHRFELLSEK